jgi:hypothetical protein
MGTRVLSGAQAVALAPAGIGLALLVLVVEIRMDTTWANGVLLILAALGAAVLLVLAIAAADADTGSRPAATALMAAGLAHSLLAIGRLGNLLAGDDFTSGGGTLTWMLALFTALAAFCYVRTSLSICVLFAALSAVALLLEFAHWVFGADGIDTFRVLLVLAFVVLFLGGLAVPGRAGTMLIVAAGLTVIAGYYTTAIALIFSSGESGLGWGWELITLLEGVALAAYATLRLEPGPGYLAFFVLLLFGSTAAVVGGAVSGGFLEDGDLESFAEPSVSLIGWPLVLAILTVLAAFLGLRRQVAAKS